jgi:hypothetical protein
MKKQIWITEDVKRKRKVGKIISGNKKDIKTSIT